MTLKITTLIENKLCNNSFLKAEHGLSIYIEADGLRILFDTGQTGKFIENAEKLNVDLKNIDYVFMSHGHYDHTGGFEKFVEQFGSKFKLLVGENFFDEKYKTANGDNLVFIGNSFDKSYLDKKEINVKYVSENVVNISENIMVFTNFKKDKKYSNFNDTMFIKKNDEYEIDNFTDEIALGIKTKQGLVVIVGCSHVGVINILDTISERTEMNIYGVIGGTHLVSANEEKIHNASSYLEEKNVELIGVSHCTGDMAEKILKEKFQEKFFSNNTGTELLIE